MSKRLKLTKKALSLLMGNAFISAETIKQKRSFNTPRADITKTLKKLSRIKIDYVDNREVIVLNQKNDTQPRLIYIHGGAYVNDLIKPHWDMIEYLIKKADCCVIVPIYWLAPRSSFDDELPFILNIYEIYGKNDCFIAGDSAGAGFSLAFTIYLRNQHKPLPKSVFLFSPWLDVTMTNPGIKALEKDDIMLAADGLIWCGKQWAKERATTDPLISPIYDELTDLPALYIYQGTADIFLADVKKFDEKIKTTNTSCQTKIYQDGFHVFMGATFLPESRQVLDEVADVIQRK
ncbi:alpha/beta hydrolase [Moraxella nasicaprae]|uniref:Alpha/beta hydrolase n=1 Tax=Moraxella nasicaprae TaxID=2904122 RepID=A0ABY6F575_9GAMM|nr:alpha/beta hydrolase [Moraxella nasicaprae]UXZ05247.1 alpha/beta hydrolase [Moraxella nasicaprae]